MIRRRLDQLLDLLGGVGRSLGERPDFSGNDRETPPAIACTGRLHSCVERQQIGLEGDFIDHADDLGDLRGRLSDRIHRRDGVLDDVIAAVRFTPCRVDDVRGLARTVGGLRDSGGDLFKGRGRFFQTGGLISVSRAILALKVATCSARSALAWATVRPYLGFSASKAVRTSARMASCIMSAVRWLVRSWALTCESVRAEVRLLADQMPMPPQSATIVRMQILPKMTALLSEFIRAHPLPESSTSGGKINAW